MKNLGFIVIFLLGSFMVGCSSNNDKEAVVAEELSSVEIEDLKRLREEEKLARDVYLFSFDKYGLSLFNNIASSEQKHMTKVLELLNTYDIVDPASATRGVFTDQILQNLYNDLTTQSNISLVEALKVGATIEDLDIYDIDEFEDRTDKATILNVYDKLKCGSRNHMRSYYGQLIANGVTYIPQYISQTELTEIINNANEKCGN